MEQDVVILIRQKLPELMRTDPEIREWILELGREYFADRAQTDSRFEQMLEELRRDREEWSRRWEEEKAERERRLAEERAESDRRWRRWLAQYERRWQRQLEEWNRRWEEEKAEWRRQWEEEKAEWRRQWEEEKAEWRRQWEEGMAEWRRQWEEGMAEWRRQWEENRQEHQEFRASFDRLLQRVDSKISAIGARWGIFAESAFREGIQAILEESFGVQVLRYQAWDEQGEVFDQPDQVELDLIIRDGTLIICEIKSSMSRSDMYTFARKVRFYERHEGRRANRRMVISPMVEERALQVAHRLGIEVYTHADEVPL
jgi:hypothetical protein